MSLPSQSSAPSAKSHSSGTPLSCSREGLHIHLEWRLSCNRHWCHRRDHIDQRHRCCCNLLGIHRALRCRHIRAGSTQDVALIKNAVAIAIWKTLTVVGDAIVVAVDLTSVRDAVAVTIGLAIIGDAIAITIVVFSGQGHHCRCNLQTVRKRQGHRCCRSPARTGSHQECRRCCSRFRNHLGGRRCHNRAHMHQGRHRCRNQADTHRGWVSQSALVPSLISHPSGTPLVAAEGSVAHDSGVAPSNSAPVSASGQSRQHRPWTWQSALRMR